MNDTLAERYLLESEIARGAAGVVHRATDLATGDPVAVKVLHAETAADPVAAQAFMDEAEVLSQLDHPGIVRPRDLIVAGEVMALVMDLVEGVDLRQTLLDGGPMPPRRALAVVAETAEALAVVHRQQIAHGDIKPGNILLPSAGGSARLVDFGVARRMAVADTATHATPDYAAPEIVDGMPSTAKSDVYGLGLVLYEALCGTNPYRGGTVDEVLRRQRDELPQRPDVLPVELWHLIEECLRQDPAGRPDAESIPSRVRAMATLVGTEPLPRQEPRMRPRASAEEPVLGAVGAAPMTTVAPAPSPSAMPLPFASTSSDRSTKPGVLVAATGGFIALVVGGLFLLSAMSTPEGTDDEQPQAETSTEQSEAPQETPDEEESEVDEPEPSTSTDEHTEDSPSDSMPDGENDGDRGNGSDPGESDTDLPGEDQIGSPMPGNPGGF